MRLILHLLAGIGHRNGEPALPHHGQVDHIVANVSNLIERHAFLLHDLAHRPHLEGFALINILNFQIAHAQRHSLANALGDHSKLHAPEPGKRHPCAIVRAEALHLDHPSRDSSVWRSQRHRHNPNASDVYKRQLLFPFAICVLWITWPAPDQSGFKYEVIGRIALAGFAALQICWSAYALDFDHYHAYAPDQAAAEFLRPFVRAGSSIAISYVGDTGCQTCGSVGLMPYFDRGMYINEPDPFWSWSSHNPTEKLFQQLLPTHPDIVILEAAPLHPDRIFDPDDAKIRQVTSAGYTFTHMFCGEMPEGFQLKRESCHLIFQQIHNQQEPAAK